MAHLSIESTEAASNNEGLKAFQEHMGYTDEQLAHVMSQPKFMKTLSIMPTPEVRNKTLVLEVVESHGCSEGMKVGDKLYFTGMALLDTKRSSNWCGYALSNITAIVFSCHNLILNGVDPNLMYSNHTVCFDAGCKYGLGQVVIKATVIEEAPADN